VKGLYRPEVSDMASGLLFNGWGNEWPGLRVFQWLLKYGFSEVPEVSYRLTDKRLLIYIRTPEGIEDNDHRFIRRPW